MTETRNHRRGKDEKPFHADPVVQSEEEISNDEWENDLCLDPNQLTEVIQHINDQNEPVPAAGQTEIEMPSPIPNEESDNVTDELPSHAEPGNVTVDASTSPSSDLSAQENLPTRPQRKRNPPVMFSYYGLGQPVDTRGQIRTISPQVIPMPVMCSRPPMVPRYYNQYVNTFTPRGYGPPIMGPTRYFQPQP